MMNVGKFLDSFRPNPHIGTFDFSPALKQVVPLTASTYPDLVQAFSELGVPSPSELKSWTVEEISRSSVSEVVEFRNDRSGWTVGFEKFHEPALNGAVIQICTSLFRANTELQQKVDCNERGAIGTIYTIDGPSPLICNFLDLPEIPLYEVALELAGRLIHEGQFSLEALRALTVTQGTTREPLRWEGDRFTLTKSSYLKESLEEVSHDFHIREETVPNRPLLHLMGYEIETLDDKYLSLSLASDPQLRSAMPLCPSLLNLWNHVILIGRNDTLN